MLAVRFYLRAATETYLAVAMYTTHAGVQYWFALLSAIVEHRIPPAGCEHCWRPCLSVVDMVVPWIPLLHLPGYGGQADEARATLRPDAG